MKPAPSAGQPPSPARFRPQLRTAPLKRGMVPKIKSGQICFRPQLRTAPLKQHQSPVETSSDGTFPSSTEDGSIEADLIEFADNASTLRFRPQLRTAPLKLQHCLNPPPPPYVFPSSTEDGSIEAVPWVEDRRDGRVFPSSTEDGSIEAPGSLLSRHPAQPVSVLN